MICDQCKNEVQEGMRVYNPIDCRPGSKPTELKYMNLCNPCVKIHHEATKEKMSDNLDDKA